MQIRDPLNFFSPYERLPSGHENQLTRALLLVLRMSPLAHVEWLRLVSPDLTLSKLPDPEYETQKRAIGVSDSDGESAELVSVFLAPERPQESSAEVEESDRSQVLDAIISYGGELITVVENKVFEADDLQAKQINLGESGIKIAGGQKVVVVLWRDLLESLQNVRERGLVGGAEAAILDDFLTYVEDHFAGLGPFRTLALCRNVPGRIERRLRQVLGDALGFEAEGSPGGAKAATPAGTYAGRDAYLTLRDAIQIELALYPADTLGQAQALYSRKDLVTAIRGLAETGWELLPNFHFGHMQRGFCWTTSEIPVDEYIKLWESEITAARSIPRPKWNEYWDWLKGLQIADAQDRAEFDRNFTNTERKTATPRPGLYLRRRWPLAGAEELDSKHGFVATVREELETALKAVGADLLNSS